MKTSAKLLIACGVAAALAVGYCVCENNRLVVTSYSYQSPKIPEALNGVKIAQISDFHNAAFSKRVCKLLQAQNPDIIVISGDFIDSRHTNIDIAVEFAKELCKIAPTYYTTGNHEHRFSSEELESFVLMLKSVGVKPLLNQTETINLNGAEFYLSGIQDDILDTDGALQALFMGKNDKLSVLISHRPELAEKYAEAGADLTFTGHAHGGQVVIPFVGGVLAPNQGFFPKYTSGVHYFGQSATVVSRGLGNSLCPIRVNNPPEIVVVTLETPKS